jgi:hypothetical protein
MEATLDQMPMLSAPTFPIFGRPRHSNHRLARGLDHRRDP